MVQPLLIKRFNEARKKIKEARGEDNSYPVLGFHGTKEKNIELICQTGFKVPGEEGFQHATDPGILMLVNRTVPIGGWVPYQDIVSDYN